MAKSELRPDEQYYRVEQYSMKCRIYPNKTQKKMIDNAIHGVHAFCNMVLYDIVNEYKFTKEDVDKKTGEIVHWANWSQITKKESLDYYRERNAFVGITPSASLSSIVCGCINDIKKAYTTPVERWDVKYYSKKHPRTSYSTSESLSKIKKSENKNILYFNMTKIGPLKVRGWNKKIRFDADGELLNFADFAEYNTSHKNNVKMTVTISKDNCNDYWVIFQFSHNTKKVKNKTGLQETGFFTYVPKKIKTDREVGIDVGVSTLATLSDGTKYKNEMFAKKYQSKNAEYHRQLSRAYGWLNIKFREAYKKDKTIKPSNNYEKLKIRNAKSSRKIQRKRDYSHNVITTEIVNNSSVIAVESLSVKEMMDRDRQHERRGTRDKAAKTNFGLSDAAMYNFLHMIDYKSKWYERELRVIGRYDPSTKTCSKCGYIMPSLDTKIRKWTCPSCGARHDRDINAAINILNFSKEKIEEKVAA